MNMRNLSLNKIIFQILNISNLYIKVNKNEKYNIR